MADQMDASVNADTVDLRTRLVTEFERYNMDFPGDRAKAAQRAFEAFTATLRALAREWESPASGSRPT